MTNAKVTVRTAVLPFNEGVACYRRFKHLRRLRGSILYLIEKIPVVGSGTSLSLRAEQDDHDLDGSHAYNRYDSESAENALVSAKLVYSLI